MIGYLVVEPAMSYSPDGIAFTKFRIADNRGITRNGQETMFFRVIAIPHLSEICGEILYKGQKVALWGRLQERTFQDNEPLYVWCKW